MSVVLRDAQALTLPITRTLVFALYFRQAKGTRHGDPSSHARHSCKQDRWIETAPRQIAETAVPSAGWMEIGTKIVLELQLDDHTHCLILL